MKTMAARREHQVMGIEEFEALAADAERLDAGARYELVYGKQGVKEVPDGEQVEIVAWLSEEFGVCCRPRQRAYTETQLEIERYRKGRARPDLLLAPRSSFVRQGDWPEPDPVVAVAEITPRDRDARQRDCVDKPRAYAETGIPVFLVIDRAQASAIVYSDPQGQTYKTAQSYPVGAVVHLPAPVSVSVELDTAPLREWID